MNKKEKAEETKNKGKNIDEIFGNEIYVATVNENEETQDESPYAIRCIGVESGMIEEEITTCSVNYAEYCVQKRKFCKYIEIAEKYGWSLMPDDEHPEVICLTYCITNDENNSHYIAFDKCNHICFEISPISPVRKDKYESIKMIKHIGTNPIIYGNIKWNELISTRDSAFWYDRKDNIIKIMNDNFNISYYMDKDEIQLGGLAKYNESKKKYVFVYSYKSQFEISKIDEILFKDTLIKVSDAVKNIELIFND